MAHAAVQFALDSRDHKLDPSHSVTNPPPRRGGLAISSKLPHTISDKEILPRGGGIRINGNYSQLNRTMLIVELPAEILVKILSYMSFNEIGQVRLVRKIRKYKKVHLENLPPP